MKSSEFSSNLKFLNLKLEIVKKLINNQFSFVCFVDLSKEFKKLIHKF